MGQLWGGHAVVYVIFMQRLPDFGRSGEPWRRTQLPHPVPGGLDKIAATVEATPAEQLRVRSVGSADDGERDRRQQVGPPALV